MDEEKFAFETDEVSIAFQSVSGLGDALMARKVFDAIIELAPTCLIDFICETEGHRAFAKAFYGDSKNLNRCLNREEYLANLQKYDLALLVGGCHVVLIEWANTERLQAMTPDLCESLMKIEMYNRQNILSFGNWRLGIALRNMILARVLHKNCYDFLSYGGTLPVRDNDLHIPLAPEYKSQFDALKLDRYITIYTDISEHEKEMPKTKAWPIRNIVEYVARMKKRYPAIDIVQCGGKGDIKIENADHHYLGVDLELTKYILANSLLHVGCEGGLVHLATFLGTKCIVLFGSNSADYTGYDSNINLVSEVCSPCMYILPSVFVCMRGAKEPPCMLSHTPQMVCEVTCNYLKNNT